MLKRTIRALALLIAVALCVPCAGAAVTTRNGDIMIRVGLASSDSHVPTGELEAAHLENRSGYGAGYRFGYYDDRSEFIQLAMTDEDITQVAVLKTQNLYYGYDPTRAKTTYSSSIQSGILVGCYHLLIEEDVRDYERAQALADRCPDGFVAWIDGSYQVRSGSYETKEDALDAMDESDGIDVVGTSSYGMNVVETGTDRILFQYDEGSSGRLAIQPDVTGAEEVRTWFSGYHYRGGFQYHRRTGGDLSVVNVVDLEDYVNGVICYEMGREWPLEALKTQALCARTYVLNNLGKHKNYGFDICCSSSCQVYHGTGNGNSNYGPSDISMRAVAETEGQVIMYDGKLASTFYSSCFGGASEDAKNVWGTDTDTTYPYLCGVEDPYESDLDAKNAYSSWTVSYTSTQLTSRLQSYGYGVGTSIRSLELTYSELGNVIRLTVHWDNGQSNTFSPSGGKTAIRSAFGVNSIRFTVNGQNADGTAAPGGRLFVNGTAVDSIDGLYAISSSGAVSPLENDEVYAVSGGGTVGQVDAQQSGSGTVQGSGTVTVSSSRYVFEGGGWGHQVGMSQYGANAMARRGYTCDEIVRFYFPGVRVRYYDQ